ncbi:WGR domain-containing protein [Cohaesibacter celericrescens]|uniref:WGR domain-containing protein n=1 Tax=Cohaesibacter celericrescens TaxID=2067669 RepID=UPI001FE10238|nr:WGR domain-containing protein [Cohaesibacter celericrescens]
MKPLKSTAMQADLRKTNPEKNMHRFYHLRIERTLFEDWCLIRRWGRIGSNGQAKRQWFTSISDASSALEKVAGIKKRRGYVPSHAAPMQLRQPQVPL